MGIVHPQIYTLSEIDGWMVECDDKGKYLPKEQHRKYDSDDFGFKDWVRITDDDFRRVTKWLAENGSLLKLDMEWRNPFKFIGTKSVVIPVRNQDCLLYLSGGVLISAIPRPHFFSGGQKEYIISPSSSHFRDEDLVEHIDLALFSEARQNLEKIAGELLLPLKIKE
ncbi:hypothetical protein HY448_01805 [Candidatus Pacearchaeota archaeon]|nr:hypothetical protein [Candidatus Pacearchaeota archaeon]